MAFFNPFCFQAFFGEACKNKSTSYWLFQEIRELCRTSSIAQPFGCRLFQNSLSLPLNCVKLLAKLCIFYHESLKTAAQIDPIRIRIRDSFPGVFPSKCINSRFAFYKTDTKLCQFLSVYSLDCNDLKELRVD